ncbi:hypothetical protein D3C81_1391330 [compost metagenome]
MNWEAIFAWIGRVATVAAPVGLAVLWFGRTYIDKWLTNRFQGQLDVLKHAQAQEVERLRAKIAGMLDRAIKLHQHEFEVLPKTWDLLTSAVGAASRATATFKRFEDVGALPPEELEAFFKKSSLEEYQKQAIRDADRIDKTTLFGTFQQRIELSEANEAAFEFHNYVVQHGIFIEPEIRERLNVASKELRLAVSIWSTIVRGSNDTIGAVEKAQGHVNSAYDLSEEVDKLISERLWSASKLEP